MFSHLIFSHKVAYEGISALCRSSASSVNQPLWRSDQCKTSVALRHIKKAMTKSVFTTHSRSLCIFRVCWWKVSGFKKTIFGRFCWWPVLVKAGKRIVSVKHLFLTTTVMNPFSGLHPNWLCWSSSPWNQGFSSEGYRLQPIYPTSCPDFCDPSGPTGSISTWAIAPSKLSWRSP